MLHNRRIVHANSFDYATVMLTSNGGAVTRISVTKPKARSETVGEEKVLYSILYLCDWKLVRLFISHVRGYG